MKPLRISLVAAIVLALLLPVTAGAVEGPPLTIQAVDSSRHPEIAVKVSLPAELLTGEGKPKFSVVENGQELDDVTAMPMKVQSSAAYAVLVIDTSGSMQGQAMQDARDAAAAFVDELGDNAKVAIISFSDEPRVQTIFTSDRSKLQNAINSLEADGETAMYDALAMAATLMPPNSGAVKSIVLLSDGGDTVSGRQMSEAIGRVKKSRTPVYAVALQSKEASPRALSIIAHDTGGRLVPVNRSSALKGLFTGIAREIRDVYSVSFKSNSPNTKDIEVDITASAGGRSASAFFAYPNPKFVNVGSAADLKVPEIRENFALLLGTAVVAFLAFASLAGGVLMIAIRPRTGLAHLKYYDQMSQASRSAGGGVTDRMRASIVDAVGYVAGRRGFTKAVSIKLEQAGLPLRPVEYMSMHLVGVVAIGFVTQLLVGKLGLSMLVIIGATAIPIMFVGYLVDRRKRQFEEQLPDVLSMIAGSLRGGWGVQQALELVVSEAMPPACDEFKRVQTEVRLGMPLEQSLAGMAERMDSDDFRAVVTAITIQREVGGNLAEVLDIVAGTIRERSALRRQVHALTAEGRFSAIILIILPLIEAVALSIMSPGYLEPLFTTFFGAVSLVVGVILMIIGSVWLIRVTKIEV